MTVLPTFTEPGSPGEASPKRKRKTRAEKEAEREAARQEALDQLSKTSDRQLLADSGIEQICTTSEAAEYFNRTAQWVYYNLREGKFTYPDGTEIVPDRVEADGSRIFTLPLIEAMARSHYRRTNIDSDELIHILRRIKINELGGEWRETEGWHHVQITKNRKRWVHPDKCELIDGEWKVKKGVKLDE